MNRFSGGQWIAFISAGIAVTFGSIIFLAEVNVPTWVILVLSIASVIGIPASIWAVWHSPRK